MILFAAAQPSSAFELERNIRGSGTRSEQLTQPWGRSPQIFKLEYQLYARPKKHSYYQAISSKLVLSVLGSANTPNPVQRLLNSVLVLFRTTIYIYLNQSKDLWRL